jgi:hypothetical protein
MRLAVAGGFRLAVHIHLDDADDAGTWRNALQFEPFTRYGPLSYWEALVRPAAQVMPWKGLLCAWDQGDVGLEPFGAMESDQWQ